MSLFPFFLHTRLAKNKFIMYGIHTTKILITEVSPSDLEDIGLRTGQSDRLLQKIAELNNEAEVAKETVKEDTAETKHNWKRRHSIASSTEYFGKNWMCWSKVFDIATDFSFSLAENIKTGKTQISAPAAFGGEDLIAAPATFASVEEQLVEANLGHLASEVNSKLEGDLYVLIEDFTYIPCVIF